MLQKHLRCIGFTEYTERKKAAILLRELYKNETRMQDVVLIGEDDYYCETKVEVANGIGLCICTGFAAPNDLSVFDLYHYYPYNEQNTVSIQNNGEVSECADVYHYICNMWNKVCQYGLMFRMENNIEYMQRKRDNFPLAIESASLTGYSLKGKIILGIQRKNDRHYKAIRDQDRDQTPYQRNAYYSQWNLRGKFELTSKKKFKYNIYNYIDTYIIPIRLEPEWYEVLGNIEDVTLLANRFTKEKFYNLKLDLNGMMMDVVIHSSDLEGEPKVGYRYKGEVYLIGRIAFDQVKTL